MARRGGIVGIGSVDREIARLALPALATLLAEPLYILTDTAIVGHLGTEQLAGLALASTVLVTGYAMFVFLAYGTTAAVSRLLGAGDERAATEDAIGSIWLAVMLSVVVVSIGAFAGHPLLAALGGTGPVLAYGWTYLSISLFGVPALLIGLAGTGYLRGLQNTRTPLVVTVAGVIVNLVIEVILIFGFDYGVGASALASVLAQWGVAVTYVSLIVTGSRSDGVALVPRLGSIHRLMRVGFELFVRTAALRGAILITTMVAAGLGTVALAAHQIVFEIWNFVALVLDSIAIAAQAMIGRLLGSGDIEGAKAATARMMRWSVMAGVLALVVIGATSSVLPQLFSPDENVVAVASTLLIIAAVWQPVNSIAFTLDGILIGAGDTRFLAWSMALAAGVFIPVALVVGALDAGIEWLWFALGVLMVTRVATLGIRYLRGAWARPGLLQATR